MFLNVLSELEEEYNFKVLFVVENKDNVKYGVYVYPSSVYLGINESLLKLEVTFGEDLSINLMDIHEFTRLILDSDLNLGRLLLDSRIVYDLNNYFESFKDFYFNAFVSRSRLLMALQNKLKDLLRTISKSKVVQPIDYQEMLYTIAQFDYVLFTGKFPTFGYEEYVVHLPPDLSIYAFIVKDGIDKALGMKHIKTIEDYAHKFIKEKIPPHKIHKRSQKKLNRFVISVIENLFHTSVNARPK